MTSFWLGKGEISVKSVERKRIFEISKYFRLFIQDKTTGMNIGIDLIKKQMIFQSFQTIYAMSKNEKNLIPPVFHSGCLSLDHIIFLMFMETKLMQL